MTELFLTILQMSLMAAGVTVIALPLRWLFRRLRLPALACVLLWLVVALRMVLPVGMVTSSFSLMGWLTPAVEERVDALARMEPAAEAPPTTAAPAETADGGAAAAPEEQPAAPSFSIPEAAATPETQTEPEGLSLPDILARVWLAGVIAVWGYTLFSWLRTRALLSTAVRKGSIREGWWWESDRIPTAFVFGVIRPRVYVPAGLEGENLRWVRRHEESHIELGHSRCKLIYFLIMGVHWFNPVLWLSWVLLVRDLELECDERVLKSCGSPREYSAALLALASPRRGPLLPPGFGETGVKDRIKRALKWKPFAPWVWALVVVLAILLDLALAADPTFPDVGLDGQYPTLRVHLETDDTEGAEVVNMGAPEDADWPETLPETACTAATPSPWVDLYLDNGQFPDGWSLTEYLVEDGTAVNPQEVELSPYGAENGFILRVEPREDAPGTGMETRVYVLSCTWRAGLRTHELEYAFRLTLPSVPPGPLTEPVVVAGDQRVDFDGDASVTAAMGAFLHVTLPDEVTAYTLEGGNAAYEGMETLFSGGGGGSFSVRLEYLGGHALGDPSDQVQSYILTYTWEDGTQESRQFTLNAYTPRPEWDDENLRIRFPGDTEWTGLDTLIPVPAEWANQDLGGRNQATDLVGLLSGTGGMVDGLNGWFVFTIGRGVGNADTYVYRTHDGGRTWTETGRPTMVSETETVHWFPSCAHFVTDEIGFLGFSHFNGAPVFRTTDGGATWARITLPLSDESWELSKMYSAGSNVLAVMTGYRSGEPESALLFSRDAGETWEILELPQAQYSELGELTVSPEQWLDAPVRLLGALPDGSAALYGLNPEETGLDGLLVEWNGSLSYFSNLTYNTGPQIMLSGLSLDDYDGDGADELAAATCTGTGTGVSYWRLDLFEWQDTGAQWQPAGARLADSLTEDELAAQINAAVDSTYDPENRNYLLQTAGSGLTVDLSSEDASAPLGGPVVCGSWFQYDLGQQPTVTALLYPQDMPMTAAARYTAALTYDGRTVTVDTAAGVLAAEGAASPDTSPELDLEHLRIRYPGETAWVELDTLIPVPRSWREEDSMESRHEAGSMAGVLQPGNTLVAFSSPTEGWLVMGIGRGAGSADTYVYRTADGGHTWRETGNPGQALGLTLRYPVRLYTGLTPDFALVAFERFNGQGPVFRTTDWGATWERLDIPLPEGQWECTEIWSETNLIFTDLDGNVCATYSYTLGDTWQVSPYIDDPEAIPLADLPWPSREQSGYFQPDYSIWADGPVKMLGFSDDRTAAVFCFDELLTSQSGLLLCVGGRLAYFPELICQVNAYGSPANPVWGDFDGDGADELAVIPISGTGTGVFMQDLYVFEWDGQSVTLGGAIDAYEVWDMDLSLPANRRIGSRVEFWMDGNTLMADIGVEDSAAPPTTSYVGALTGPVAYDGRGLTLDPAALAYTEDTSF